MALTPRLDLRQGQALVMTPQLQQAIKLLQMSSIELTAYVENELEQNPLLERDETSDDGGGTESAAADGTTTETPPEGDSTPDERRDAVAGADTADAAETWHEEAGREGEGNLDYAGDPEAWKTRTGAAPP
ncbi:MAG TPA: RNA polymerase sigma-54 factor, partial [Stellaceae bacterium]|nr:RNA polymerase sigma-54 factor [Stellaceae bacterium]